MNPILVTMRWVVNGCRAESRGEIAFRLRMSLARTARIPGGLKNVNFSEQTRIASLCPRGYPNSHSDCGNYCYADINNDLHSNGHSHSDTCSDSNSHLDANPSSARHDPYSGLVWVRFVDGLVADPWRDCFETSGIDELGVERS